MRHGLIGVVLASLSVAACDSEPVDVAPSVRRRVDQYMAPNRVEKRLCFSGYDSGDRVVVDSVYEADLHDRDTSYVASSCEQSEGFVGSVHNHPSGVCEYSSVDSAAALLDGDIDVHGVVCGTNPLEMRVDTVGTYGASLD